MTSARNYYHTFDKPVPYKNLLIYPVKVKDYYEFSFYMNSLMLEKNSIKDNPELAIRAISMSYFQYMVEIADEENKLLYLFDGLLRLVLDKRDAVIRFGFLDKNKPFFSIDGEIYTSSDFDEIRLIISEQNMVSLPDFKIQKQVRETMEEARRFKQKVSNSKLASFEEQLMAISLYWGMELEKVYEMPIRKFFMAIKRANQMIMSNIYLTASMSGFVTFKNKDVLAGWLSDVSSDDEYADVKMDTKDLENKANFSDAMK